MHETKPQSGIWNSRGCSSLERSPAVLHAWFRYNPFTAADEKVPLSVVQVNNKPQYIVFSLRFPHHASKHGHLPVESLKSPYWAQISRSDFAPKSMQTPAPQPSPSQFQPSPRAPSPQGAKPVQKWLDSVDMWRTALHLPPNLAGTPKLAGLRQSG
jgi:hypothetical protein